MTFSGGNDEEGAKKYASFIKSYMHNKRLTGYSGQFFNKKIVNNSGLLFNHFTKLGKI